MKFNPNHPVSQMLTNEVWRKLAFLILKKQNLTEIELDAKLINKECDESGHDPKSILVDCSYERILIKIVSEKEAKELAAKNLGPAQ